MEKLLEYVVSVVLFVIAGYICYLKFKSHPSDKYHNDSWKEQRRKKNKY
jgi:hypothetical protein